MVHTYHRIYTDLNTLYIHTYIFFVAGSARAVNEFILTPTKLFTFIHRNDRLLSWHVRTGPMSIYCFVFCCLLCNWITAEQQILVTLLSDNNRSLSACILVILICSKNIFAFNIRLILHCSNKFNLIDFCLFSIVSLIVAFCILFCGPSL